MSAELLVLGWSKFLEDSAFLAGQIRKSGYRPDLLVAIARGGWIVGRLLSDLLNIQEVSSLMIKSYKGIGVRSAESSVWYQDLPDLRGRRVLIVDDIADTGLTLKTAVELVRGAGAEDVRTATLYMKSRSSFKPDYFVRVIDRWVVFPYEYCEVASELLSNGYRLDELIEMGFEKKLLNLLCKVGVMGVGY
ncbi:MAG: phosphoribosyltransferase [Thermofilum sp.]|uniref:Phosphoribosyltransferase n=1 Tax=Thermofilum pendens TaxID=2269 RepID=A0A7C4HAH7_THEPE